MRLRAFIFDDDVNFRTTLVLMLLVPCPKSSFPCTGSLRCREVDIENIVKTRQRRIKVRVFGHDALEEIMLFEERGIEEGPCIRFSLRPVVGSKVDHEPDLFVEELRDQLRTFHLEPSDKTTDDFFMQAIAGISKFEGVSEMQIPCLGEVQNSFAERVGG